MVDTREVEKYLQRAVGTFEYSFDNKPMIKTTHNYAYFPQVGGVPPLFVGRDSPSSTQETGVYVGFPGAPSFFWGDKVSLSQDIYARYVLREEVWTTIEGSVTGIVDSPQKAAYVGFEFTAQNDAQIVNIKGSLILRLL